MSGHEVMVQRITAIIAELYQRGFVSSKKMMDEFNISERTLYRDLNRLGDRIIPDGDGIYRLAPAYAKPQALKEQQNLISVLGMSELFPAKKIVSHPDLTSLIIRSLPGDPEAKCVLENNYSLFHKAIRENSICEFHYKEKHRTVAPYKLINIKSICYLGAVENEKVKGFQLTKIHWLKLKSERFTPQPHITQYLSEEDDVWFSLDKQIVLLKVAADVSRFFKRRNVLPAQKLIRQEPNGDLILQTKMAHENQLFPLLRYWLPSLTIISPVGLQQHFYLKLNQQIIEMKPHCSEIIFDNIQQE
ncbi:WYL domain-containing protein [Pantoea stewartii]|uniref:helix-turn-helix transcriptional regulator n=1 Tax=Pantoea stewartii TaxID=66269 RepID=UPI0021D4F4F9|nr:WYL domain-containing protein [Pantoea stewartii]MCU7365030.1 WYL domain-containing protein [Pantoea stewartii]